MSAARRTPSHTDSRAALAEAIENAKAEREHHASAVAAIERAETMRREACHRHRRAEEDVERARQDHGGVLGRADGRAGNAKLREALQRAEEAEAELKDAKNAVTECRAAAAHFSERLHFADEKIDAAVANVMHEVDFEAIIADCEKRQGELIAKRLVLRFLDAERLLSPSDRNRVQSFLLGSCDLPSAFMGAVRRDWRKAEAAALEVWKATYARLREDANTPLPG